MSLAVSVSVSIMLMTNFISESLSPLPLFLNRYILEEARSLGLIGAGYIWIVSSLTTGNPDQTPEVVSPPYVVRGGHFRLSLLYFLHLI